MLRDFSVNFKHRGEVRTHVFTLLKFKFFLSEDVYFAGGFITRQHHNKVGIDAIQIETPRDLRIEEGEEGRRRFGHALGKAISQFYHFHFKESLME